MHSTSHIPMRTGTVHTRAGTVRRQPPGRPTAERLAIAESAGR